MITKFELLGTEIEAAEKFLEEHRHKDVNKGPIGGHIRYKFIPTSLGNAVSIECMICKESKNITDYNLW